MRLVLITTVTVLVVWLVPLFLSVESGLKFGWPYQIFFTLIILFGVFLFYLLSRPAMPPLKSTGRALGSIVLVFVISVGAIILLAKLSPQFALEGPATAGTTALERGKALFNDPDVGCFLCHTIAGSGGTRGPNLSHVASAAGQRRLGMSAEDYLRESLLNPGAYVVSPYDNIMPPLAQRFSLDQLGDMLSYLLSLK